LVSSIYMSTAAQSAHVRKLLDKYRSLEEMAEWRESATEDAELLLVAFGICARVALSAVRQLRARGVKAGLFRPTTLFPFPAKRLAELGAGPVKRVAVVELNRGMMACDVAQALPDRVEQRKLGWLGGEVPGAADLLGRLAAEFPDLAGLAGH
jgi:2-oxoglutarate ferredoxin oxidoreductase subunit alpha